MLLLRFSLAFRSLPKYSSTRQFLLRRGPHTPNTLYVVHGARRPSMALHVAPPSDRTLYSPPPRSPASGGLHVTSCPLTLFYAGPINFWTVRPYMKGVIE